MARKIKIGYLTKNLPANGITNVILNYSLNLDRDAFEIVVLAGKPVLDVYKQLLGDHGVRVIELPEKTSSSAKYYLNMAKNLIKERFDIVHVHGNSATITVELLLAKLAGTRIRIAHCHNSTCDNLKVHQLLLPLFKKLYTKGFACSELAGRWLFQDQPFTVLPNGFETSKYIFNSAKRAQLKEELGLNDKFVIGTVARFNYQKNHPYLLKVFEAVAAQRADAWLILVGDGPDLGKIQELIAKHPYQDRIIYYGVTDKVEDLYNGFDVFVLPTRFEGLGIVFLEAQINGLPVVTTTGVPQEVALGERIVFLDLAEDVSKWSEAILASETENREDFYSSHQAKIERYDIKRNAKQLAQDYLDLYRQIKG